MLIEVSYLFNREDDVWVATCPEIGASSFGDTIEEAHVALNEAVGMLLAEADDGGYLSAYLRERHLQAKVLPEGLDSGLVLIRSCKGSASVSWPENLRAKATQHHDIALMGVVSAGES